jgi:hypothetical protein
MGQFIKSCNVFDFNQIGLDNISHIIKMNVVIVFSQGRSIDLVDLTGVWR